MLDVPGGARVNDPDAAEGLLPSDVPPRTFGRDRAANLLRALDMPYVALNPGASFRGLPDSLMNHFGNEQSRIRPSGWALPC